MTQMMERVIDPVDGVAPGAAIPGYRVAGKTGTAQRVAPSAAATTAFTVSFAGFAPADDPRFTIYVVVHNPRNGGGGGSVAGPVFAQADELHPAALRRTADRHTRPRGCPSSGDGAHDCGRADVASGRSRPHGRRSPTRLARLAASSGAAGCSWSATADVVVTGLSLSSQRVQPGDLYAALPGARAHGIGFVGRRRRRVRSPCSPTPWARAEAGPTPRLVIVDRPRALLGRLAAWLYGEPATSLRMIGVTGTQGKTTTARLAEAALQARGRPIRRRSAPSAPGSTAATSRPTLTTPEAPDLHGLFAMMRETEVGLRDGGVQPRPGDGPGRRRGLRRRRVHQPRP